MSASAVFVLDSTVILAALLGDAEEARAADEVIGRIGRETAIAPAHVRLEVARVIAAESEAGRLAEAQAAALAREAAAWPIEIDEESDGRALGRILALALAHRLGVFEAAYLELAVRRAAPLATFDARLARVARIHAVGLILPTQG